MEGNLQGRRRVQFFNCNLKLVGARHYKKGVIAANPYIVVTMKSSKDTDAYRTHTSSTTAGNYVEDVSYFGYANGTDRGVAPRSRVAIYEVL